MFREESGFTLIELLCAVVVTTIGVIALITTLDTSRELITFSEKRETAVHVAEQEIERIQSLPYEQVALTAPPATSGNAHDPAYYVTGIFYRWDLTPGSGESGLVPRCSASGGPTSRCERLVVNGGTDVGTAGTVSPSVTTIVEPGPTGSARISLEVQRFVTWADDPCPDCTSQRDYKRVSVAVKIAGAEGRSGLRGGVVAPVVLTTLVSEDRSL
jgi:prepilin-type N-terminal cleavage/methylation domain-containing protein